MKLLQKQEIMEGNEVLFIERGVPHTGVVSEIYENLLMIDNVTFLHTFLDKTASKEDSLWSVKPSSVIKTARYYLPKYPSVEMQVYISQIMHNAAKDNRLEDTDIFKFMQNYQQKSLLSVETNVIRTFPESFIYFYDDMLIKLKQYPDRLYVIKMITYPNFEGSCDQYPLLKEYAVQQGVEFDKKPVRVLVPKWFDIHHGRYSRIVLDYVSKDYQKYEVRDDINEYSIEEVWNMNEIIKNRVFYSKGIDCFSVDVSRFFFERDSKVEFNRIYFENLYKR